ncbi:PPE family protein, partial [Mycobacterium marinum]|uniref:PPE family protein n=1 Tax=Mycobacterium marinum TaxID=1781 RepID=UPI003FEF5B08
MNFSVLPPEINSLRIFAGTGSGPMLAAAAAWDGLADELSTAAAAFSSVTSGLTGGSWQSPAAAAMAAAAAPYAGWLGLAAARAGDVSAQAKVVAAAFEAVRAATVHPMLVAANRAQLVSLVRSNLLGLNAPAIATTEAEYEAMWAADVAAMVGYHGGASAAAAQLTPWQQWLQSPPGLPGQLASSATAAAAANGWPNLGIGNTASNVGSGDVGTQNLGSGNTGNTNLGSGNTGNGNLGSGNRGDSNVGSGNSGNSNWGSGNTGNHNQGSGNHGDNNVGFGNAGL